MNSNSSVICIGELLIDFFCKDIGKDLVEGTNFEKEAGGAPANVCATIVKLGGEASFSGKVGDDPFGHFLKNTLDDLNIDTSMIKLDDKNRTTFAFVSLKDDGERDFVFNRGADAYLTEQEMDQDKLKEAGILHFGSATALLEDPFQSTYLNTMKQYKSEHHFISFDPNYRTDLWRNRESEFIELARHGVSQADFVKVSEEELKLISGVNEIEQGVEALHHLGTDLVAVTLGKRGTMISNGRLKEVIPSIKVESIDSTGAGDAFVGAMLYQLAREEEPQQVINDFQKIKEMTTFSNKVGAMVCTKLGAISAIPTQQEIL